SLHRGPYRERPACGPATEGRWSAAPARSHSQHTPHRRADVQRRRRRERFHPCLGEADSRIPGRSHLMKALRTHWRSLREDRTAGGELALVALRKDGTPSTVAWRPFSAVHIAGG